MQNSDQNLDVKQIKSNNFSKYMEVFIFILYHPYSSFESLENYNQLFDLSLQIPPPSPKLTHLVFLSLLEEEVCLSHG